MMDVKWPSRMMQGTMQGTYHDDHVGNEVMWSIQWTVEPIQRPERLTVYRLGFLHAFLSSSNELQLIPPLVPIWRNADSCGSFLRSPDAKPELQT